MDRPAPVSIGIGVLATLALAALVPPLRLPVFVALAAGAWLTRPGAARWALAAGTPVALILAWGELIGSRLLVDRFTCADPLSALAWLRVAEAALVVAAVVLLARRLGSSLPDLGLARPTRRQVLGGGLAILVLPVPSLYLGAILAEPFFGPMRLDLGQPLALLPALTLAVANGTMEELAYRGALLAWLSRATGPAIALVGQAVVFGLAHTGSDFTASPLPVVLAVMAGGLVAGLIVRRSGSLWIPILVHVALDVPLYYAAACRLP